MQEQYFKVTDSTLKSRKKKQLTTSGAYLIIVGIPDHLLKIHVVSFITCSFSHYSSLQCVFSQANHGISRGYILRVYDGRSSCYSPSSAAGGTCRTSLVTDIYRDERWRGKSFVCNNMVTCLPLSLESWTPGCLVRTVLRGGAGHLSD